MAKRNGAAISGEAEPSLEERLKRERRQRILQSIQQKRATGKPLTKAEQKELLDIDLERRREHGVQYLRAMPKGDYLRLFGGSSKVHIEWRDEHGFPWPEKEIKTINLVEIVAWYRQQFIHGGNEDSEDVLLRGASQTLKNEFVREKIREKQITNKQKAIELEKLQASYVPIGPIIEAHNELAERIRKTRERLVRDFDGEERDRIERAFDDLLDDFIRDVETKFGNGSDSKSHVA